MKKPTHLVVAVIMLFLCDLSILTYSCPPEDCDPCYEGNPCVWDCETGEGCCMGAGGDNGECCDLAYCCHYKCRECCNDSQCSTPTPACDLTLYTCVECNDDSDCTGCTSCNELLHYCYDDQSKCPGTCDVCQNGTCVDDDVYCPGQCLKCVNGECQDDQNQCSGCQDCVNGSCVDNDDNCPGCQGCFIGDCFPDHELCPGECNLCIDTLCENRDYACDGCESCQGGTCFDDDGYCSGCESCINTFCVDDNDNCPGCVDCVNTICVPNDDNCDTGEICCEDGSCKEPCEQTNDTTTCSKSHESQHECLGCQTPPETSCREVPMRIYTGNTRSNCEKGCPGDCEQQDDVLCYTEYNCSIDEGHTGKGCALDDETGDLFCHPGFPSWWICHKCIQDPRDPGEETHIDHKICVE